MLTSALIEDCISISTAPWTRCLIPTSTQNGLGEHGSSGYQEGDTWYRDMRAPGFNGDIAEGQSDSLQWLGYRISGTRGLLQPPCGLVASDLEPTQ